MPNSRFTEQQIIKVLQETRRWPVGRRGVPEIRHQRCGLRDERLTGHLFANLNEARQIIEDWREDWKID
jgi:hypothetical protein